jgi:hypothetical protein
VALLNYSILSAVSACKDMPLLMYAWEMPKHYAAKIAPSRSKKPYPKAPPATGTKVARPTRDWASYNNELRDRPVKVLELVVDTATLGQWREKSGRPGMPAYSPAAISACYMLRSVARVTLRGTEGLVRHLFEQSGGLSHSGSGLLHALQTP